MNAFSFIDPGQLTNEKFTDPDATTAFNTVIGNIASSAPSAIILLVSYIRETTGDTTCIVTFYKNSQPGGLTIYKAISLPAP